MQKDLEKIISICVLQQGEQINLLPNAEELKQTLKELGAIIEREYLVEKDQQQRLLQEKDDKLAAEQQAALDKAIEAQIIKFRGELVGFFQELYKNEQDRLKAWDAYLKNIEERIARLSEKIQGLEEELQTIESILKDKKDLAAIDDHITALENQLIDDHTNLAMQVLKVGGVEESPDLRTETHQKTANFVRANREGIVSGAVTSKHVVSAVVNEVSISAKEKEVVQAVIEEPPPSLQEQFAEVKEKTKISREQLMDLGKQKREIEARLEESRQKGYPEDVKALTKRAAELVQQIAQCKAEKTQLEGQAEGIRQRMVAEDKRNIPEGNRPDGP